MDMEGYPTLNTSHSEVEGAATPREYFINNTGPEIFKLLVKAGANEWKV
jgi:hypothetical protein